MSTTTLILAILFFQAPALTSLLIDELLHPQTRNEAPSIYVQALLDALIRMGAIVPTNALLPYREKWTTEVLAQIEPFTLARLSQLEGFPIAKC